MQCQAKSKRTGEQCRRQAMTGKTVCMMHGGKTPSGIASPHFRTGRHAKDLPARLQERYQASLADGELLALQDEISLVDARLADLLSRVDSGESGAMWTSALGFYNDLRDAIRAGEASRITSAMIRLGKVLEDGTADYHAWMEIQTFLEQRRKLVESERKRLVEMQQVITAEQAMVLVSALMGAIKENVTDRSTLSAIQTSFTRITHGANQP